MSVATRNPFALLDEERSSSPQPAAKKDTPAAAPAAGAGTQAKKPSGRTGGPASRGGKYPSRGGAPRAPREPAATDDAAAPAVAGTGEPRKFDGRGRGRGRGGRGGAGGGGGRGGGFDRNDRRAFDRHSQTGKTDSDKKVHQSWGGDDGIAELKTEEAATADAAADWAGTTTDANAADSWGAPAASTADAWGAPAETAAAPSADAPAGGEAEGKPRREREPEEEDHTLTFDQYLAQKKESALIPKLEGRKIEGEEGWTKSVVPLQKSEEEPVYFIGKGKSAPKQRTKKEEKVYIDIEPRFVDSSTRGTRGRGGRGGDRGFRGGGGGDRGGGGERGERGGRGRGGGRGGAGRGAHGGGPTHHQAVNVDDQTAFPSLS